MRIWIYFSSTAAAFFSYLHFILNVRIYFNYIFLISCFAAAWRKTGFFLSFFDNNYIAIRFFIARKKLLISLLIFFSLIILHWLIISTNISILLNFAAMAAIDWHKYVYVAINQSRLSIEKKRRKKVDWSNFASFTLCSSFVSSSASMRRRATYLFYCLFVCGAAARRWRQTCFCNFYQLYYNIRACVHNMLMLTYVFAFMITMLLYALCICWRINWIQLRSCMQHIWIAYVKKGI